MENIKMLGLPLLLLVLQFTNRSYVHANGISPQLKSDIDFARNRRNGNQNQQYNFVENMDLVTAFMDYILNAADMVLEGSPTVVPKNFIKLFSALDMFANATTCDPSSLDKNLVYIAIVSIALNQADLDPFTTAEMVRGIIESNDSKIKAIRRTIKSILSTKCLSASTEVCNQYIYRAVSSSGILSAETRILAKYADLAQDYVRNYHDEFMTISKADQVQPFLIKSLGHLKHFIKNIIETRQVAGIKVDCNIKLQ